MILLSLNKRTVWNSTDIHYSKEFEKLMEKLAS